MNVLQHQFKVCFVRAFSKYTMGHWLSGYFKFNLVINATIMVITSFRLIILGQTKVFGSANRFRLFIRDSKCAPTHSALYRFTIPLQWRHNGHDGVLNHQPHHCLLDRLFGRRSKKTSKLCVIGLCAENSPGTGEFPAQKASNAENVSIWWRHHALLVSHIEGIHAYAWQIGPFWQDTLNICGTRT